MSKIKKLKNKVMHYEWGSLHLLQQFLGLENSNGTADPALPFAELWMGTHKNAPSHIITDEASDKNIDKVEFPKINNSPSDLQNAKITSLTDVCGELPFLLKLLAVEKPLSIQAHPDKKQAEEGFLKEENACFDINDPARNYKDSNHKPEIVCALTPFTLMAGFREPEEICKLLDEFSLAEQQLDKIIEPMKNALKSGNSNYTLPVQCCKTAPGSGSLSKFLDLLLNLSKPDVNYLCSFFLNRKNVKKSGSVITDDLWELMKKFAQNYPCDPAILSPLYLNTLTLQPGQAIYVPARVLHAYISGFAVELMTSSDNVLRGGLTPKYIDKNELMNILDFSPFIPQVISPPEGESCFFYHTPCEEFLLLSMKGKGESVFPGKSPSICVVIEGELKTGGINFKKGDSFFIPKGKESYVFEGSYSLFAACMGMKGDPADQGSLRSVLKE